MSDHDRTGDRCESVSESAVKIIRRLFTSYIGMPLKVGLPQGLVKISLIMETLLATCNRHLRAIPSLLSPLNNYTLLAERVSVV